MKSNWKKFAELVLSETSITSVTEMKHSQGRKDTRRMVTKWHIPPFLKDCGIENLCRYP